MALIQKQVTKWLTEAVEQGDVDLLNQAFSTTTEVFRKSVIVDGCRTYETTNDLYLFCAEAALHFQEFNIVRECVERLLEVTTTTKAYQIRVLYVRALLDSHDAAGQRTNKLVEIVQAGITKIMRGIRLALQDPPKFSHLVHAGTQHYWKVALPLYKEGSFGEIAGSLAQIVQALERIEYSDTKARVLWLLRLATALAGSGKTADANATLNKAADMASKGVPSLKLPVFRMQASMSKLAPNPKVRSDAAKGVLRAVFAVQAVYCGLLEGPAAEAEALAAYNDIYNDVKNAAEDEKAKKGPGPGAAAPSPPGKGKAAPLPTSAASPDGTPDESAQKEEALAELGMVLALLGFVEQATNAYTRALASKRLRSRVFGEYTAALVQAIECGGYKVQQDLSSNECTGAMVSELVNAVRRLDRALDSAMRIPDVSDRNHVVQYGAVLVWNISLPLLQPTTRAQISKPFQSASKCLDDIGSNMAQLKTLLHYEAAQCDMDCEYLNKASARVAKALGTDYVPDAEDARLYALERPLDRFLVWMKRRLDTKSNLYQQPDNPEDEALLLLEQAKDAPVVSRASMLNRASGILKESEPAQNYFSEETPNPGEATGGRDAKKPQGKKAKAQDTEDTPTQRVDAGQEAKRNHLRTRAHLWNMVATYAWTGKHIDLIPTLRTAADHLAARTWVRKGDRDMCCMQAVALMNVAESHIVELRAKKAYLGQYKFIEEEVDAESDEEELDPEVDEEGEVDPEAPAKEAYQIDPAVLRAAQQNKALVDAAQRIVSEKLVQAAQIGVELCNQGWEDQWIPMNCAMLLWNWSIQAFEHRNFLAMEAPLESLFNILLGLNLDVMKEGSLLRDIAYAHVRSLLQQYFAEKMPEAADSKTVVFAQEFHTFTVSDGSNARLQKASEVCEKMIALLPTPMEAKKLISILATIRRLQNKPQDVRANPQMKALQLLEVLSHPTISQDERKNFLNQAFEAASQDPNVELCARVAARCLETKGFEKMCVKMCQIGQNMYDKGLLGKKQADAVRPPSTNPGAKGAAAKGPAATPQPVAPEPPAQPVKPTEDDWLWYSLLLQYQGASTTTLINPSLQDKLTQYELRRQALVCFTNSAAAALQGNKEKRLETISKAVRHFHYACQEFAGDATSRRYLYPPLKLLMSERLAGSIQIAANEKAAAGALTLADVLQYLYIALLRCMRDQELVNDGLSIMKMAVKQLPVTHHQPFWDLDIQLRCQAGLPTSQTLLRVKEYSVQTQARVWYTLACCSKNPTDQLFALQSAIELLQGYPVDQAEYTLAMAQWMLESGYAISLDDLRSLILSAADLVSDAVDPDPEEFVTTDVGSAKSGMTHMTRLASNASGIGRAESIVSGVSATTHNRSNKTSSRQSKLPEKGSVRQISVMIHAYFMLAKIGTRSSTLDGLKVDVATCLMLVHHYVMRIWGQTAMGVNQFIRRSKVKAEKAATLSRSSSAANLTVAPPEDKKKKQSSRDTRKSTAHDALQQQPSAAAPPPVELAIDTTPVSFPTHAQGWAGFQRPTHLTSHLRNMKTRTALCPAALEAPQVFVALLEDVVRMMLRENLDLCTLAVFPLIGVVLEVMTPKGPLQTAAVSANNLLCQHTHNRLQTGCGGLFKIPDPIVPPADRAALLEDTKIVQQGSGKAQPPSPPFRIIHDSRRHVYQYWIEMARTLLQQMKVSSARDLLCEASVHARAYSDTVAQAQCMFLQGKIAVLEGKIATGLRLIQDALKTNTTAADVHEFVEMRAAEVELLLRLEKIDEAFVSESNCYASLGNQYRICNGVAKEVSNMVSDIQFGFCAEFVQTVARVYGQRPELGRRIAPAVLEPLKGIVEKAVDLASGEESLQPTALALQLLLLEYDLDAAKGDTKAESDLRGKQHELLTKCLAAMQKQHPPLPGTLCTPTILVRPTTSEQIAEFQLRLGECIGAILDVNSALLEEFRNSNRSDVEIPLVAGGTNTDLEKEVIVFMRNTKKQRMAAERRKRLAAGKNDRDARRAAKRAEVEAELERRREQKREEAATPANKKEKKGAAKSQDDTIEGMLLDEKAGIDSPPESEDEGLGEDSQTDEEKELRCALQERLRPSSTDAFEAFNRALDLSATNGQRSVQAKLGLGASLRRMAEDAVLGFEARQATLRGDAFVTKATSAILNGKWTRPLECLTQPEEEVKPTKGGKKAVEEKKADRKQSTAAERRQSTVVPVTVEKTLAMEFAAKAPKPPMLSQAIAMLEDAATHCVSEDRWEMLGDILSEYAQCHVQNDATAHGARYITLAQAAKMANYAKDIWHVVAPTEAREVALLAASEQLKATPDGVEGAQNASLSKQLYAASSMLQRIRVTEAMLAFPKPGEAQDPAAPPPAAPNTLPADIACMVIHVVAQTNTAYVVFAKGTSMDVRRCSIDVEKVRGITGQLRAVASQRTGVLLGDLEEAVGDDVAAAYDTAVKETEALLEPLLEDFHPAFTTFASKAHLVLCVDPLLLPLPLEEVEAFKQFRSIARELSMPSLAAKLNTRAAEKFNPAAAAFLFDSFNENPGCAKAVFPEPLKIPSWSLLSGSPDAHGFLRPPTPAQVQRLITQPQCQAFVADVPGKLSDSVALSTFACLALDNLRLAIVADRGVNQVSTRRENAADMTKSAAAQWAEQPWCVAVLLMARGVHCCVTNHHATRPSSNDVLTKVIANNMERAPKNVSELVHAGYRKEPPTPAPMASPREASGKGKSISGGDPFMDPDMQRVAALDRMDRRAVVVYGLPPDEVLAPGGKNK